MTITSYGFTGSLNASTWAQGEAYTGARCKSSTDLTIAAVAGSRSVTVGAGEAWSAGVRVALDSPVTVSLGTPAAGQWFLVAARRDWSANLTTFVSINGPTTTTSTPTAPPTSPPGSGYNTNPGVLEDQPLAWVWCNNSSTSLTIYDCRVFRGYGIPVVGSLGGLYLLPGQYIGQEAANKADSNIYICTAANTWVTRTSYLTSTAGLATASSVTTAQNTANTAQTTANSATTTANSASSTANTAQSTANTANSTANTALGKANTATQDTGWSLSAITLSSGWNTKQDTGGGTGDGGVGGIRTLAGNIVELRFRCARSGAAITAGSTGNFSDVQVATIANAYLPAGVVYGQFNIVGVTLGTCRIDNTGLLMVTDMYPSDTINTGDQVEISFMWTLG